MTDHQGLSKNWTIAGSHIQQDIVSTSLRYARTCMWVVDLERGVETYILGGLKCRVKASAYIKRPTPERPKQGAGAASIV